MLYKREIDRLAIGTLNVHFLKRVYQHVDTLPFTLSLSDNTIDSVPNGYDTYANLKKKPRMMNLNKVCLTSKCEKGEKVRNRERII